MRVEGRGAGAGKVILLGEHAVVYGVPAIAAGLDRGAQASARVSETASTLQIGGRLVHADGDAQDELAKAFAALLAAHPLPAAVAVEASCELPPGGGLGSSAALGVAIARALESLEETPDAAHVAARAAAWESVFHGNPSGIDATAALRGGCFVYRRDEGARPLQLAAELWLCIGKSGPGASTRGMVESVARLFARRPETQKSTLEAILALVKNAELALEAGDLTGLGRLMDLNQMLLAGLMVSTEEIERMCVLARENGALGAKLTGAGGGGAVVALCASKRADALELTDTDAAAAAERILAAWRTAGFEGLVARVRRGEAQETP
jgi:mevalonate kinase